MRAIVYAIALAGWLMLGLSLLPGCDETPQEPTIVVQPEPPPGYERTTTGSGCRDTISGEYVERSKCDPMADIEIKVQP